MLVVLLIKELLSLSDNSLHILVDVIQLLDLFALFNHLFINNRLLIFYVIISAILLILYKSLI